MKSCQSEEINRKWQKIQIWAEVPGSSSKSDILQNNWLCQHPFDEREFKIRRIQSFFDFTEDCSLWQWINRIYFTFEERCEVKFHSVSRDLATKDSIQYVKVSTLNDSHPPQCKKWEIKGIAQNDLCIGVDFVCGWDQIVHVPKEVYWDKH